jgi:hypothetical protein
MSDKLTVALTNLEKARNAALEAAIADRAYRMCVLLDGDGPVQRAVEKARRLVAPREESKRGKK